MKLDTGLLFLGCAMMGAMGSRVAGAAQEQKPNIVFILVDNAG